MSCGLFMLAYNIDAATTDRMEAARGKATLAASLKVQEANRWLQDTVKEWPETFTAYELVRLAATQLHDSSTASPLRWTRTSSGSCNLR